LLAFIIRIHHDARSSESQTINFILQVRFDLRWPDYLVFIFHCESYTNMLLVYANDMYECITAYVNNDR